MDRMNLVKGTWVKVSEDVFDGKYKAGSWGGRSRKKPEFLGKRTFTGMIERDSYGVEKNQHTFSIRVEQVIEDPLDKLKVGDLVRRKGRTLYDNVIGYEAPADYNVQAKLKEGRKLASGKHPTIMP